MTDPRAADVQQAINFLLSPQLPDTPTAFSPYPDYASLAGRARELGHDLPPEAIEAAFRMIMRARLLA